MTTWSTGVDLTKTEEKELRRLMAKHKDLVKYGSEVLKHEADKKILQEKQQAWVTKHGLSCFRCGATVSEWAKGGVNERGRAWVICKTCVRKPK